MKIKESVLRSALGSVLAIVLLAAPLACERGGMFADARPSDPSPEIDTVILISIDSLRADRLGAYGHSAPTSPTLDRLATEGLRFDRAYSTTSWTLPAHAAMLSGLDDYAHGAYQARSPISPGVVPLAEHLDTAGIESIGFFSGPFLHPTYGFARGFDRYIDATSYGWKAKGKLGAIPPHHASHGDVTNPIVLRKVADWLNSRVDGPKDQAGTVRSFVFIHLWDVHYDYIAPPAYIEIFDPNYEGTLSGRNFLENSRIRPNMPRRDLQHLLALYDAEIRYTDDTIAQLLALFEAADRLGGKSAVIVTADHGEEFFDHGRIGHGLTLHEEVLRVPLILWLPGQRPIRSVSDRVVSHIDIAPTVCAILAVDCQYSGVGESLLSDYWLEDPPVGRQDALAELTSPFFKIDLTARIDPKGVAVRNNRSGWLSYSSMRGPGIRNRPARWKAQAVNGIPETIRRALNRLQERAEDAKKKGTAVESGTNADDTSIDANTVDHLRALGYLEGE